MSGDINELKMSSPESLFSLEVVVEKLAVPSVVCRFPAVAFRLLDFPTLMVYHVEPDLAHSIKEKINSDPHYRVPPQLQELKDKTGYFVLKKGKSCLFKVSPESLQSHLMNTPLYVMLIDTYPNVPKLLGNCAIPLDDVMTRISDDINQHGISAPSAHGEKGGFKVYNLMGFEIGDITLGFRLLSLGMGLIPHIPDNVVSVYEETAAKTIPEKPIQYPPPKPRITSLQTPETVEDMVENIVQNIQSFDKNTQVAISEFLPTMENIDTQTDGKTSYLKSSGIQTDKKYCKKRSKQSQRRKDTADRDTFSHVGNEMSDFFVTNMACPPPMYYNSEADDIQVFHQGLQQGLTFTESGLLGVQTPNPNYAWGEETQRTESSICSDDTIRHEDLFTDSDVEEAVDFKSKRVLYNDSQKAVAKKEKAKASKMTDVQLAHNTTNVMKSINQQASAKLQQLPLLNALLTEIMTLQGLAVPVPSQTTTTVETSRSTSAQSKGRTPRGRLDREEHMKKLATPRMGAKQAHAPASPHKICAGHPQPVPKNKSWVRKDSETAAAVPKTKLSYGMTNAQRLRLAKTNPALLEKLEKEDQVRIEKSRERTKAKYQQPQYQHEMQIGERLMHSARSSTGLRSQNMTLDLGTSMDSTNFSDAKGPRRQPIPTPRRSLSMKQEQMREILTKISSEPEPSEKLVDLQGKSEKDLALPDPDDTLQDVTIENAEKDTKAPTLNTNSVLGTTKTLYNPGFPSDPPPLAQESRVSRPESRLTDYNQYSEDFENGTEHQDDTKGYSSAEEPSLRKIVDRYSDDSESMKSSALGDEPSLRKIVDKYSSDDEDQDSFRTAASQYSNISDHSRQTDSRHTAGTSHRTTSMVLNIASMPNPRASIHSPVTAAIRQHPPPTGEGLAASSTPTESEQHSTAYFRESQMPTMSSTGGSYEPGASYDPVQSFDEQRRSAELRPRPTPRRKLDRFPSVHTESVSSYAPSDDNFGMESENNYTESFDEDSDSFSEPAPVKQMGDLKLAPEARMGYTWGYS